MILFPISQIKPKKIEISKDNLINQNSKFGISSYQTWSINYDSKLNSLYVGTIDNGLYRVDIESPITYYPPSYFKKEKLHVLKMEKINSGKLVLGKDELIFINQDKIMIVGLDMSNYVEV